MTTNLPVIRRRRDSDITALTSILVRVYALDGYPVEGVSDPAAWLRHPRELQSWTAEVNDEPIGQVTLTSASADDDAAKLWCQNTGRDVANLAIPVRLFIAPEHRRIGAARLLMKAAIDHASAIGSSVAFDVMAKDREAIRLYEQLGARRLGEIPHHYGDGLAEPALVYAFT